MHITILDQLAFMPEHLAQLRQHGEVIQFDDFPDEQAATQRLQQTDIAIVGWTPLPRAVIAKAKNLRCIALAQTGYEFVDLATAKEQGITVCYAPGYSRESVAEYAFALMLAAMRHIPAADRIARTSAVPTGALLGNELQGKTLGILGLGSIGSRIGAIGQGFGMHVIGHSRTAKHLPGIQDVSLDELLQGSDVLVIAVEVNETTIGLLSAERLQQLKPGTTLVNVVSNRVLDEQATAELLRNGHLKSAAFEELTRSESDKQDADNPLLHLDNVVLSPQAGWYTTEAEQRLLDLVIENVTQFMAGKPQHVVD